MSHGRAAASRRARARSLNRRTEAGSPPPGHGPAASVVPGRSRLSASAPRSPHAEKRRASSPVRTTAGCASGERAEQLVTHQRDRWCAHGDHHVALAGPAERPRLARRPMTARRPCAGAAAVPRRSAPTPPSPGPRTSPGPKTSRTTAWSAIASAAAISVWKARVRYIRYGWKTTISCPSPATVAQRLQRAGHRHRVVGVLVVDPHAVGSALELEPAPHPREGRQRLDDRRRRPRPA